MQQNKPYAKIVILLLFIFFLNELFAQKKQLADPFESFVSLYSRGDFLNAEACLLKIIKDKKNISDEYQVAALNNLGVICIRLSRYKEALNFFNQAEDLVKKNQNINDNLADIYINKSRIYGIIKEHDKAIGYLEQAVKIYFEKKVKQTDDINKLSIAYLNLGLTYFEKGNIYQALIFLNKSYSFKIDYNLPDKGLPALNLAKVYSKLGRSKVAHDYYLKCIEFFKNENGDNYYRLADVYFDYGLFLQTIGKSKESYVILQKALEICLKNYGEKHTFVSLANKLIGDFYLNSKDYQKALIFYQKSLIAVVADFNDQNIDANPSLNSVLFDIRLLENLKSKARALDAYAAQHNNGEQNKHLLKKSFETIELGLNLIARIRSGYISPESKFYLAENEKETYFFAVQLAQKLFELTNDASYINRMYSITCISKAAVLRNEIAEHDAFSKFGSSNSLILKYRKLQLDISSYSKLIEDEVVKNNPDKSKVDFWKTALFDLNRKKEFVYDSIKKVFPDYIIQKAEPVSLNEIQKGLKKDETIVEYFLSNYSNDKGQRGLYLFTISRNLLRYRYTMLDSAKVNMMRIVKDGTSFSSNISNDIYTEALYCMYESLIKPIESDLVGKKIIVVPDEEIAYLPFDAFLSKKPNSNRISYDELQYLIYNYTFSYGYTSSLLGKNSINSNPLVIAFYPKYSNDESKGKFSNLIGAGNEIHEISKFFKTEKVSSSDATESKFISKVCEPAILHLAMHSTIDKNNSKYSYLVFDSINDKHNDGRLYNYEIGNTQIKSPMVVLSACNTGDGSLMEGEGVMSLARGFFLAGVPSVICTYWDVNDNASEKIMKGFYFYLSKGYEKCEALRNSKLDYLAKTPPVYSKPSYWAAYEVYGDNTPINRGGWTWIFLAISLITTAMAVIIYYFMRSKIS